MNRDAGEKLRLEFIWYLSGPTLLQILIAALGNKYCIIIISFHPAFMLVRRPMVRQVCPCLPQPGSGEARVPNPSTEDLRTHLSAVIAASWYLGKGT